MHWIRVWWHQPDHHDWLSDYLAARRLKPIVRYVMVAIMTVLAAATTLILISPSGPQSPILRTVAVAVIATFAAMALVWLLTWPTRTQSQIFSLAGAAGIAAVCLIEGDPRTGIVGCTAFAGLAGYVAFFHTARLLVVTLGTALGVAVVCAARIAAAGDAPVAVAELLMLSAGMLAAPVCSQTLVHWLQIDAGKSSTDPLTGLRNRRGFYRSASKLVATQTPEHCLSVLMVDLDNFKRINDTHGHATGDRILIAVAESLRQSGGSAAVIARVGGEEFLIAEAAAGEEALQTAEKMRHAIACEPWGVTASLGVSRLQLTSDGDIDARRIVERLVEAADTAMYEAKRAGGNRVRLSDFR